MKIGYKNCTYYEECKYIKMQVIFFLFHPFKVTFISKVKKKIYILYIFTFAAKVKTKQLLCCKVDHLENCAFAGLLVLMESVLKLILQKNTKDCRKTLPTRRKMRQKRFCVFYVCKRPLDSVWRCILLRRILQLRVHRALVAYFLLTYKNLKSL